MQLVIHGPNLFDQSKGTFHVHTLDCSDNAREVKNNGSVSPITLDAATIEDVVEMIYSDHISERESEIAYLREHRDEAERLGYTDEMLARGVELDDFVSDFHFAPCIKKLPHRSTDESNSNTTGADMSTTTPKYNSRNLRIVDTNTAEYQGGFTVEHGDVIVAGPYAAKSDAKQAKLDLIAGNPVKSDSVHPDPQPATSAAVERVRSGKTSAMEEIANVLGVEMTPEQKTAELDAQNERVASKPAKKTSTTKKSSATKSTTKKRDEEQIENVATSLAAVEQQLKLKKNAGDETMLKQRDELIVKLIKLDAGYTFIAKTRGVPTSTNRGLCRVLMGGKRL